MRANQYVASDLSTDVAAALDPPLLNESLEDNLNFCEVL